MPQVGPGQVLVRVSAAALNNTDIWTREGAYGLPGRPDAKAGWRGPVDFPRGPGRGHRRYRQRGRRRRPGGLGGPPTYVAVGADRVHGMSDSPLPDEELAALPVVAGAVVPFDLRRLYLHNLSLIGSSMHTPAHFAELAKLARGGALRPRIAAGYRLGDIHDAQAEFRRGTHIGKIVLTP